jgi:hypothetical protein
MKGKADKFIIRIRNLIGALKLYSRDIVVHRQIDLFYYMQKEAQMRELDNQMEEALKRLEIAQEALECEYKTVYSRWRKDVRWLTRYRTHVMPQQKPGDEVTIL